MTALEAVEHEVAWVPAWGRDRIFNMIAHRPDWTISRQRVWGVPIVAFYCRACEGLAPFSIDPSTGAIRYVGGMALISGQVYVRNYLVFDGRTGTPGGSNFNPNFGKLVVIVQ